MNSQQWKCAILTGNFYLIRIYKNGGIKQIKTWTFQLEGIISVNQILNALEQSEVRLSGVTWPSYNCMLTFYSLLFFSHLNVAPLFWWY